MSLESATHVPSVSRRELEDALARGQAVLVDVLSPESFAANHIEHAINLPVAQIPARAREVLPDRSVPIICYCGGPT